MSINYLSIVKKAWRAYGDERPVRNIVDISAKVSTNHVYKIEFENRRFVVAKLSWFGKYEHFVEDHSIINILGNVLEPPLQRFLARSLLKNGKLFTYRHRGKKKDIWVVFYNPIQVQQMLPRRLDGRLIKKMGQQMARFHKACSEVLHQLPDTSKTIDWDIKDLLRRVRKGGEYAGHVALIEEQCNIFMKNSAEIGYDTFLKIPIFVDWNIGNFSVTKSGDFFSRWDYDWFRMCSRVLDFYFMSRVCSDAGDRTVFSYLPDTLLEDRFGLFLKAYHAEYPLTEAEVRFIKEAYRFFILHYVVQYGKHFFRRSYAAKLQREAYELYLPELDQRFDVEKLLKTLKLEATP